MGASAWSGQQRPREIRAAGLQTTPEVDGSVTGTPGPDVLIGTPDTDLIKGKGGDDVLCGLGAPDALLGGRGNDTLHGGHGRDDIWPGTGNDQIFGEANGAFVTYRDDPGPIFVDIGAGVVEEPASSDALFDVKGVWARLRPTRCSDQARGTRSSETTGVI